MLEHRFAQLTAAATFLLLVIGGTVNPTGSSLACPEPTFVCHGELFPPMVGGVFYEHGHRLAAMTVGLLQIALTFLLMTPAPRPPAGSAGSCSAWCSLQGVLGAITVKYKLPWFVSTGAPAARHELLRDADLHRVPHAARAERDRATAPRAAARRARRARGRGSRSRSARCSSSSCSARSSATSARRWCASACRPARSAATGGPTPASSTCTCSTARSAWSSRSSPRSRRSWSAAARESWPPLRHARAGRARCSSSAQIVLGIYTVLSLRAVPGRGRPLRRRREPVGAVDVDVADDRPAPGPRGLAWSWSRPSLRHVAVIAVTRPGAHREGRRSRRAGQAADHGDGAAHRGGRDVARARARSPIDAALWLLAGTALIVGAANTLNMWLERDIDCLMTRTKNRPLPQGRLDARDRARVRRAPGRGLAAGARDGQHRHRGARPARAAPLRRRLHADEAALALGGVGRRRPGRDAGADGLDRRDRPDRARRASRCSACCSSGRSRTSTRSRMYRQREYDAAGLKTLPGTRGVAAAQPRDRASTSSSRSRSASTLVPLGVAGLPYLDHRRRARRARARAGLRRAARAAARSGRATCSSRRSSTCRCCSR